MTTANPFLATGRRPHTEELFQAHEVELANRNSGILLETLRHDLTPVGLHYLLSHFDVPYVPDGQWQLQVAGQVRQPLVLDLGEIKRLPERTLRVTLECAGNGRAAMTPRYPSMPWTCEAVGTAEWTGTPLRHILERAGLADDVVEISFIGADAGFDRGHEHAYGRSLKREMALNDDVLRGVGHERRAAAAAAWVSAAPDRARLVRHGEREMAEPDRGTGRALQGLPAGRHLHVSPASRRADARP